MRGLLFFYHYPYPSRLPPPSRRRIYEIFHTADRGICYNNQNIYTEAIENSEENSMEKYIAHEILEEWKQNNEKYLISEPDLYYKEESFNAGDTNICFILGHSGSGKSSMAKSLEGHDIDHIELDELLLTRDHFTMEELKAYSDMFFSFFNGEGAKYYIGEEERKRIPKEDYEDKINIYRDFFGNKPETIFREEETSYKPEAILNSLKRMDKYFAKRAAGEES